MTIRDTVNNYFEYINRENFDQLFDLFCADMKFSCPVDFVTQDPEKIKAFYNAVPENYPEHLDQPINILVEGNMAAVQIQFTGKRASGQKVEFSAVDWFTFEGDRIKTLKILYDSLGLSRLLKK
jgi:ketosteroid isomerase-like protein